MGNGRTWAAVKRRFSGSRRRGDQRGAVLVEAIIVIPILMMITLGVIEYGGAYREDATVAAATRAGARTASALSKSDFGVATAPATDSGYITAQAVASVLQSLGSKAPQQVWIYQVNASASCAPPTFSGCTYKIGYGGWNSSTKQFTNSLLSGSTPWPAAKQSACAGGTIDQVGVWVTVNHTAVTHMFGTGRALTGKTVMRFEPNVSNTCAAS